MTTLPTYLWGTTTNIWLSPVEEDLSMTASLELFTRFLLMSWMHISLPRPQRIVHLTHLPFLIVFSYRVIFFILLCWNRCAHATDLDGILLVFIKILLPFLLNFILTSSTFFFVWKISNVVSIPKVNSPTERSEYCPIFIFFVFAKAFEIVLFE
jgi:hypothetical protein